MTRTLIRILLTLTLLVAMTPGAAARKTTPQSDNRGFSWILVEDFGFKGAELADGTVLIPTDEEFTFISLNSTSAPAGFFIVTRNNRMGAYSIDGQMLVAPQYATLRYDKTKGFIGSEKDGNELEPLNIKINPDGSAYGDGLPRRYRKKPSTTQADNSNSEAGYSNAAQTSDAGNNSYAPTTEILSIDDEPAASSHNLYPQPLKQGYYNIKYFTIPDKEDLQYNEGRIYYNAPTKSIYIVIPDRDLCMKWDNLYTEQRAASGDDNVNSLVYRNAAKEFLLMRESPDLPGVLILACPYADGALVIFADRDSYHYMSPSEVARNARR